MDDTTVQIQRWLLDVIDGLHAQVAELHAQLERARREAEDRVRRLATEAPHTRPTLELWRRLTTLLRRSRRDDTPRTERTFFPVEEHPKTFVWRGIERPWDRPIQAYEFRRSPARRAPSATRSGSLRAAWRRPEVRDRHVSATRAAMGRPEVRERLRAGALVGWEKRRQRTAGR